LKSEEWESGVGGIGFRGSGCWNSGKGFKCYISFYPEEPRYGKDIGFNLIGCAPDVLPVLSIFRKSEQQNSVGGTWSIIRIEVGEVEVRSRRMKGQRFGMTECQMRT
jgi:hypothetical protein